MRTSDRALPHMELSPNDAPSPRTVNQPLWFAADAGWERCVIGIWPRLGHAALARRRSDPARIARLIGRRTSLPLDTIAAMVAACGGPGRPANGGDGALPRRRELSLVPPDGRGRVDPTVSSGHSDPVERQVARCG